MTIKWQYKEIWLHRSTVHTGLIERLDAEGYHGWELCSLLERAPNDSSDAAYICILKRPLTDDHLGANTGEIVSFDEIRLNG